MSEHQARGSLATTKDLTQRMSDKSQTQGAVHHRTATITFLRALIILAFVVYFPARTIAAELIMFAEAGCPWCARWDKEVGVLYDETPEGKRAPLRRLDIHAPLPDDLKFLTRGRYTPTFVLIDNGREIGRIRGYPGEDFFWGLLSEMLGPITPPSAATQ